MCIPAVVGEHKVKTVGWEKLVFDCDKKGAKVNNKRLTPEYTLAGNGVLYVINDVLIPDRGEHCHGCGKWNGAVVGYAAD